MKASIREIIVESVANSIGPIALLLCDVLTVQNNLYGKSTFASETTQRKSEFRSKLPKRLGF